MITISEELALVAVHRRGLKRTLEPVVRVLARADQALQILERYKARLDAVSNSLSALEVEDLVTVRDVSTALQRAEMVRRIAEEIEEYVIELGADGRLILLQLEELMGGVEDDRRLFAKDYFRSSTELRAPRRDERARGPRHRDAARPARGRRGAAPPARRRPRHRGAAARLPARCTRSRGCPRSSPTTSSSGSPTSRRSCGPGCRTSSRSRASAKHGPERSRTVSPASPRPRSSSATSSERPRGRRRGCTRGRAVRGRGRAHHAARRGRRAGRGDPRPAHRACPSPGLVRAPRHHGHPPAVRRPVPAARDPRPRGVHARAVRAPRRARRTSTRSARMAG